MLLIGAGANRKLTARCSRSFVEKTGIPFITTQMGKGVVDEGGELFLGNTALSDGDFVHRVIARADLIINVGHDVVEKPPFFMTARWCESYPRQFRVRRGRSGVLSAGGGGRVISPTASGRSRKQITPQAAWNLASSTMFTTPSGAPR